MNATTNTPAAVAAAATDADSDRFGWVRAAGGPEVRIANDGRSVVGMPDHQEAWWSIADGRPDISYVDRELHLHLPHELGTLMLDLAPGHREDEKACVRWSSTLVIEQREVGKDKTVKYVWADDVEDDFKVAYTAAMSWRPERIDVDGVEFWTQLRHGRPGAVGWVGGWVGGDEIVIVRGGDNTFNWTHSLAGAKELASFFEAFGSRWGVAGSLMEAASDALAAPQRLRALCAEVLFGTDAERDAWAAFQAGIQHGRELVKAE